MSRPCSPPIAGEIGHNPFWAPLSNSHEATKRPINSTDQQKMLVGYINEGIMSRNEARDVLGMDPIPGGEFASVQVAGQGIRLGKDLRRGAIIPAAAVPPAPRAP